MTPTTHVNASGCRRLAPGRRPRPIRGQWLRAGEGRLRVCLCTATLLMTLTLAPRCLALDPSRSIHQYNCQTWSQQHGLPANGINAIAQTDDGYLWLGASPGLIRFDGISFTLVGMAQTPGLRTTEVQGLATSPGGGLWFGIKVSAYGHYDGRGNWTLPKESTDGTDWGVPVVMKSGDGRIWIGGELASVRSGDGQLQRLFPAESTSTFVNSFLEDSRGRIWAGTNKKGLYYLELGQWVRFSGDAFDSVIITALAEDNRGQLWVGTDVGLSCFNAQGERQANDYASGKVGDLLVDRRGALWVGTFGNGLWRNHNGVWNSMNRTDGLADDYVLALAEDKEGNLWIGSRGGLSQLTDVKLPTFGLKEGLNTEIALGVSASPRGGLWVGTPAGAAYFDGQAFIRSSSTNSDLQTVYAKRVLETRGGDVYVLNGKNEINIYADGTLLARQPTDNMPVAMIEDAQGMVVSVGGDLFRVGRNYLTPYSFTNGIKPTLDWVLNLAPGRDGSILIACVNGICRIKDGAFEQWTVNDGLKDNQCRWVFEDADGTIWAGLSTGMARIRGREIRNILRENGLFDGNIYGMVPDDAGQIWMDSNRGIFRVSKQSLNDFADGKTSRVAYVSYEGPASVKPADKYGQEQSACRTLDGRIWFPGSRGIVMIDPANLQTNKLPPPVHIARVRANGQELVVTNEIAIPPGKGELEFQYSALSYIVPQNVRFRHQLQGYDPEWIEAENRRVAVYNNLKPGRYTFRVTAANADGVWNESGDSLTLELRPHFYQTGWFYFLCGALGLVALGGLYAWRIRLLTSKQHALQQARDHLEAEVASRTTELAESKALYQSFVEQLPSAVFRKDKEGRYSYANASFCQVLGLAADQIVGRQPLELMTQTAAMQHSPEAAKLGAQGLSHHQAIMRTGRQIEVEDVYLGAEGTPRYFHTVKSAVFGSEGQIIGTQGILFDVTQRRQAEAELTYERELLMTLLDHSPDAIYFKDAQSRFLKTSKSLIAKLEGKDTGEVIGKTDFDMFAEEHARPAFEDEQKIIRTGVPLIGRVEKEIWKDGRVTWALTNKMPLRNKDGQIIGTFGISKDITAIKEAEVQLAQVHKQLLETSRLAGMSEVATSVLHNVGNVLNSVNISANLVVDSVKRSRASNLDKVVALLREHADDLGTFFTTDPRGRQLPAYLSQLSEHFQDDQKATARELDSLQGNIEHIKEIVAMQQNYAKVSGLKEIINLNELVEDSLRINAGALNHHFVEVIREFDEVPPMIVEKHKILQILVNLLRNAKHACQDSERADKRLTVRVANGGGRIKISVIDNGVGISPENLTRIFNHGFTTRKDGHGFGLHSGALAARELGGSLTVQSDGPGHGAAFTLELPVQPVSTT